MQIRAKTDKRKYEWGKKKYENFYIRHIIPQRASQSASASPWRQLWLSTESAWMAWRRVACRQIRSVGTNVVNRCFRALETVAQRLVPRVGCVGAVLGVGSGRQGGIQGPREDDVGEAWVLLASQWLCTVSFTKLTAGVLVVLFFFLRILPCCSPFSPRLLQSFVKDDFYLPAGVSLEHG